MNIPGSGIQFWGVNTFKNKQVWLNSEYCITTDQNSGHLLNGFGDLVGYMRGKPTHQEKLKESQGTTGTTCSVLVGPKHTRNQVGP